MFRLGARQVVFGDNLAVLRELPDACCALCYIDPPFNTGGRQERQRTRTVRAAESASDPDQPDGSERAGDRTGFGGKRYRTEVLGKLGFDDAFDDYLAFLEPRLREARRVLTPTGSFFLHVDYREAHYCKVLLDAVFGREHFMNEIIWAYDYGARSKRRWPAKHDTIFWYVQDPRDYTFDYDEMDRIPYMAPGLVTREKAKRGKTPTDVWWHTIVSPTGKEKTGYPTQKPLGVLERIVKVHSRPGERVLDFFAGSGTTGAAALRNGRDCLLIDDHPDAIRTMQARFAEEGVEWIGCERLPSEPAPSS